MYVGVHICTYIYSAQSPICHIHFLWLWESVFQRISWLQDFAVRKVFWAKSFAQKVNGFEGMADLWAVSGEFWDFWDTVGQKV